MTDSIKHLLKYIDDVILKSKSIYELGAKCALYINLNNRFSISDDDIPILEPELAKRDHQVPMIAIYNGEIYNITIVSPWELDENDKILKPNKTQDLVCSIQDLTPDKSTNNNQ